MSRRTAVAVVLLCGLPACSAESEPPTAGQVLREGVDMVLFEMSTYVTREGIRRARLEADTAEFRGENEIHLRPVSLTFFDETGAEKSVVTADFGIFYELTEDMEAQGSVVVLDRVDDQRLETEKLRYVRAEDRLYGDVPFTLWSDGGTTRLQGSAFESDPSLDSFRVPSPSGTSERPPRPAATAPAGRDSDTVPANSGATPSDSGLFEPDSSAAPSDSGSTLPDTTAVQTDSSAVPSDSSGSLADTTLRAKAARSVRGARDGVPSAVRPRSTWRPLRP